MATLRVEIVTAERTILETEADMVIAPGAEGQLGILPRHAPLITALAPGVIRLKHGAAEEETIVVSGGFLEVRNNRVIILADASERDDEIDIARAEEAVTLARERIQSRASKVDLERAVQSLHRAQVRVKVARRRRTAGAPPASRGG